MDSPRQQATRTVGLPKGQVIVFRKYRLKVTGPGGEKRGEVVIDQRHATLGGDHGNDLVLDDPAVSRVHCEITVDDKGYLLKDQGSKNGTTVDGLRVLSAYLKPRCVIGLGESRVTFEPVEENAEIPVSGADRFGALLGASLEMRALYAVLEKVSAQDVTVLVEGESGTGKELVASEIHEHSRRKEEPLVVFDCGAVPESLMESALFGHVKGAFTGASADKVGAFQAADRGTLFLDEIGELSREVQPKLLRVLEAKEVRPVGSTQTVRCDVRVVAATNRDLAEEVKTGRFREDLFYRLNVVRVKVPPLRRRAEDVPALIENLLDRATPKGRAKPEIPPDTLAMLSTYSWPGNVRELRNFVERYLVFTPPDAAGAAELLHPTPEDSKGRRRHGLVVRYDLPFKEAKSALVEVLEVQYCKRLLEKHRGNVTAAAREAGIHRKYLELLVKKHTLK